MQIKLLSLALYLSAGAVQAQCPTASNLANGIRFTLANNETETFHRTKTGLIEAVYQTPDIPAIRVLLAQGIYLLEVVDLDQGVADSSTRSTYSYPLKPGQMPLPQPGGAWTVKAAVLERGSLRSETQDYEFGNKTRITFGACSYDMIPIKIDYPDVSSPQIDLLHYLPELGLSYLSQSTYDNSTDTYRYVSIEALN